MERNWRWSITETPPERVAKPAGDSEKKSQHHFKKKTPFLLAIHSKGGTCAQIIIVLLSRTLPKIQQRLLQVHGNPLRSTVASKWACERGCTCIKCGQAHFAKRREKIADKQTDRSTRERRWGLKWLHFFDRSCSPRETKEEGLSRHRNTWRRQFYVRESLTSARWD